MYISGCSLEGSWGGEQTGSSHAVFIFLVIVSKITLMGFVTRLSK